MDPVDALRRLGGVATLGELMGPTTPSRLRTAVLHGAVVRLRRGTYGLAGLSEGRATAAQAGGSLSHLSAAQYWGWKVKFPPLRPTVTLPRHLGRRPVGDLDVRWADLRDDEVRREVTSRVRTVLDCARTLDFDEALAVADSALREGVVTRHEL
ncbi:MAG: hypothetical protein ACI379_09735, partial [Nocardioides sp.]